MRINPALTDLRLRDVLDAIVKTADQPIKYSILDYAVVFSLRGAEPVPLEIQTFRLGREGLIHLANGSANTNGLARPDVSPGSQPQGESENSMKDNETLIRRFLTGLGIDFNTKDRTNTGKMFVFDDRTRTLIVRSTAHDLDKINAAIQALDGNSSTEAKSATGAETGPIDALPKPTDGLATSPPPSFFASTNDRLLLENSREASLRSYLAQTGGRQNIVSKLSRIKIDSIKYERLPLSAVIKNLSELARSGDPDHAGIVFLLDRTPGSPSQNRPPGLGDVRININPAISDLWLGDALDAVIKTADQPIKYAILEGAVVFSFKSLEPPPLEIRTFRMDPDTFRQRLESSAGLSSGNVLGGKEGEIGSTTNAAASKIGMLVRHFLAVAGADFSTNNPANAGKTFIFNERKGTLIVRSTPQDLDMIEAVIQTWSSNVAPQVQSGAASNSRTDELKPGAFNAPAEPPLSSLEFRTFHFDVERIAAGLNLTNRMEDAYRYSKAVQEVSERAGVEFPRGNSNHTRVWVAHDLRRELTVCATPAELDRISAVLDQLQPRPQFNIRMKFVEINEAVSRTAGVDWLPGHSRMLPIHNQSEKLLEMPVDPPGGNHPVAAPKLMVTNSLAESFAGVLTAEQSRAATKVLEQHDGIDILSAPGITTEAGREAQVSVTSPTTVVTGVSSTPIGDSKVKIDYRTQPIRCGFMLDVVPEVSADGNSLDLKLTVSKSEFLGYGAPRGGLENWPGQIASPMAVKPLPHFRLQQLVTRKTVEDGQTIVLTGFTSEEVVVARDRVPVLGDLPLLGRLFRRSYAGKTRKNLIVFVTPTLIYPDGTRYNSDLQLSRLHHGDVSSALSPLPAGGR